MYFFYIFKIIDDIFIYLWNCLRHLCIKIWILEYEYDCIVYLSLLLFEGLSLLVFSFVLKEVPFAHKWLHLFDQKLSMKYITI